MRHKGRLLWTSLLAFGLGASACTKKKIKVDADENTSAAIAAAAAAISGAASSMQSGNELAYMKLKERAPSAIEDAVRALLPPAHAAVTACSAGAYTDSCDTGTGTRSATYSSCAIGSTGLTYSGDVTLAFSRTATCTLAATGDTVTRTLDVTRTTSGGGQVATDSDAHTDYRGNTISGGTRLTKTASGHSLDILGLHKVRTKADGSVSFDVSVRTTSPFTITDPTATSFTVDGGSMEVIHNRSDFVATAVASDLAYDYSSCCYPTSGSLAVTFSGEVSGTGTVTFGPTCGEVTLTQGAVEADVTLVGCQ